MSRSAVAHISLQMPADGFHTYAKTFHSNPPSFPSKSGKHSGEKKKSHLQSLPLPPGFLVLPCPPSAAPAPATPLPPLSVSSLSSSDSTPRGIPSFFLSPGSSSRRSDSPPSAPPTSSSSSSSKACSCSQSSAYVMRRWREENDKKSRRAPKQDQAREWMGAR